MVNVSSTSVTRGRALSAIRWPQCSEQQPWPTEHGLCDCPMNEYTNPTKQNTKFPRPLYAQCFCLQNQEWTKVSHKRPGIHISALRGWPSQCALCHTPPGRPPGMHAMGMALCPLDLGALRSPLPAFPLSPRILTPAAENEKSIPFSLISTPSAGLDPRPSRRLPQLSRPRQKTFSAARLNERRRRAGFGRGAGPIRAPPSQACRASSERYGWRS